ncbi:MAG: hypothetical protein HY297_02615 [Thaumarchaeota archaeon]|nr:hypothetical protein [Nitrososphaerota archaeon]
MGVQPVTELSVALKRIGTATYVTERAGIVFKRVLIFQTTEKVPTDRFLVSDEAVRVLDTRE